MIFKSSLTMTVSYGVRYRNERGYSALKLGTKKYTYFGAISQVVAPAKVGATTCRAFCLKNKIFRYFRCLNNREYKPFSWFGLKK